MTPAETIAAAITKLTEQRDAATPGPWLNENGTDYVYTVEDGWTIGSATLTETAELVVTLHATIDAQLAILQEGHQVCLNLEEIGFTGQPGRARPAFNLARAIVEAGA